MKVQEAGGGRSWRGPATVPLTRTETRGLEGGDQNQNQSCGYETKTKRCGWGVVVVGGLAGPALKVVYKSEDHSFHSFAFFAGFVDGLMHDRRTSSSWSENFGDGTCIPTNSMLEF